MLELTYIYLTNMLRLTAEAGAVRMKKAMPDQRRRDPPTADAAAGTPIIRKSQKRTNTSEYQRKERQSTKKMDDPHIMMERHEMRLGALEHDIRELRAVQAEIRSMNETLVTLASELRHTNEHLERHEKKIDEIESRPRFRMQQTVTAIIAAIAGGLISMMIGLLFG